MNVLTEQTWRGAQPIGHAQAARPASGQVLPRRLPRAVSLPLAVVSVVVYLGAITIFGKGPTYLPYPPLFWGELVMLTSLVWLICRVGIVRALVPRLDLVTFAVIAFMLLGALRMMFSFGSAPAIDVIRDSATWYYAGFYFIGAYIAREQWMGDRVWRLLGWCWMAALIWGTADLLSGSQLSRLGPVLPWRGEPLISNSVNELVEHMALGAFLVLNPRLRPRSLGRWIYALAPLALCALAVIAASRGRGAKTGLALGLLILLCLRLAPGLPLRISRQVMLGLATALLAAGTGFILMGDSFLKLTQLDRFAEADPSGPAGTAHWRMLWWERLAEAVHEQNPLFGIGFGESLNVYNPYLRGNENERWPVRSPHNVNMTIFSRLGWTGAILWALLIVAVVARLVTSVWRGHWHRRRYEPERREELAFWILMLVATWGNGSFGVLMEGPVLGVWFWFAAGFATGRTVLPRAQFAFSKAAARARSGTIPSVGPDRGYSRSLLLSGGI